MLAKSAEDVASNDATEALNGPVTWFHSLHTEMGERTWVTAAIAA